MQKHSLGFVVGIVVSIILGFGIVAGIALSLRSSRGLGYEPTELQAPKTGPNSATLSISTFPDSQVCHADADAQEITWVTYCPTTSFVVPANSTITVVIDNYDSATALVNPFFQKVQGTIGNVAVVNGKTVSQINGADAAHTFAIQSTPDSPNPLFVNVPLLGVASNAHAVTQQIYGNSYNSYPKPNVISFQFHTGPPGTYIWHCYDPCGDTTYARNPPFGFSGPMSTTGWMAGTLTVASY